MVKFNKKKTIILALGILGALLILVPVSIVGLYLYFLQQTVNEGQDLISKRCRTVNPLIIIRREKNYQFFKLMTDGADRQTLIDAEEKYRQSAVAYIQEENKWLTKYKDYLDYKFTKVYLLPEMFNHEQLRYQLIEKERDITSILAYMIEKSDFSNVTEESKQQIQEATQTKDRLEKEYDNFLLTTQNKGKSWHYKFLTLPELDCPEELQNIPDMDVEELFIPKIFPKQDELTG